MPSSNPGETFHSRKGNPPANNRWSPALALPPGWPGQWCGPGKRLACSLTQCSPRSNSCRSRDRSRSLPPSPATQGSWDWRRPWPPPDWRPDCNTPRTPRTPNTEGERRASVRGEVPGNGGAADRQTSPRPCDGTPESWLVNEYRLTGRRVDHQLLAGRRSRQLPALESREIGQFLNAPRQSSPSHGDG